jgi:hypothetical protein
MNMDRQMDRNFIVHSLKHSWNNTLSLNLKHLFFSSNSVAHTLLYMGIFTVDGSIRPVP